MKKALSTLALALLCALPAAAAEQPTETVSYKSGDETVSGYVALPSQSGRRPAIIVIQEWWGLNDFVKAKARDFASKGYVALAVDLYRGKTATDADTAHQLMRGMPEDRAMRDLKAAFAYLESRTDVDKTHIGAVGWCMGGGYALALAAAEPRLAAAVIYYGRLITEEAKIKGIKAPLLGSFGELDKGIPKEDVLAFEKKARKLGRFIDFKIYPGAGHAFASSTDPKVFLADKAKDADQRTDSFLLKTLGGVTARPSD